MSILRTSILTVLLVLPLAISTSTLAAPNDGRFVKSAEGQKKARDWCAIYKEQFDKYEKEADEKAGTKAAADPAAAADVLWGIGQRSGCAWAQ